MTAAAALTALGIVYGDLGTSPLYTLQSVASDLGGTLAREAALGSLSLIVWALIITISVKYCVLVMRADNHGEGGILALMSLIGAAWSRGNRALIVMGLFGAALIYGDGVITPAISVLSALEGINVATDSFKPYVLPLAVVILIALFSIQARGTAAVGKAFGPIMLAWFITIAVLGVSGIVRRPEVLRAIDPAYAVTFLLSGGIGRFAILGAIFLAITGGEALYADMGHIGRNPIRAVWYALVLPALVLSYAGQTALFLDDPSIGPNPFFKLAPSWAVLPLVALSTIATIIASQAIITGSFSLTRQAMQLGWFPGVHIRQTSSDEYGQIYVPFVNWGMMLLTVAIAIGFGSSDRLAGAYGTAVATTMLLTTLVLFAVMRRRWRWSLATAAAVAGCFLVVDAGFFGANLLKIREGGWVPLLLGIGLFIIMTTWHFGAAAVHRRMSRTSAQPAAFFRRLRSTSIPRVPGTAIFLTRLGRRIPPLIVEHAEQMGALHETLIALTVQFEEVPRLRPEHRVQVEELANGFWHVRVHYGFVEIPDLPGALRTAKAEGCPLEVERAVYFSERDEVVRRRGHGAIARWRVPLFAFMFRNSVHAADRFNIPNEQLVEISRRVEV
ncbi:MAG: KUP/HAK/KT family potassium transporter [Alphaproteobacteria bacterium]|nr:KUP/HAK/KT family potassium transporter [Alphaproteobacteria bacterium]